MIEEQLYEHSGKSPLIGFFIALGLGAFLAILLGFVYNSFIISIPIVYINFFATIGFGTILGYGIKFFSRFGKIRNGKQNIILAGTVGFIGFYFQWIAYFVFLNSGEHSFQAYQDNFNLFYDIGFFIYLIKELNESGSWGMFGIIFTDFPLWIIWGIEALIIIGIPIIISMKHPIVPFSETLNKWYSKYTIKNEFVSISAQNHFKKNLIENTKQTILNLSYGEPFRFSKISIFYLEDEQTQYISIDNVHIEDRGKGKSKRTSVVHLVQVDTKTAKELMDKYVAKKQFIFNY